MDANENPPSERDWTPEEMEEFFSSQDATGLFSGAVANNARPNDDTWMNLSVTSRGIHVTRVGEPESGWLIAFYCPLCKETWFRLSPWAVKPSDGDYWRMEMCGNDVEGFRHNMALGMRGYNDPVELKPSNLWWMKEKT